MTDNLLISDTVFTMIVSALASYRVARMLALETGPFGLFAGVRSRFDPKQETWIGKGLNCPYCIGMWASLAAFWVLQYNENSVIHFIVYVFAVAGIQTIIQSWEPQVVMTWLKYNHWDKES